MLPSPRQAGEKRQTEAMIADEKRHWLKSIGDFVPRTARDHHIYCQEQVENSLCSAPYGSLNSALISPVTAAIVFAVATGSWPDWGSMVTQASL